MNNRIFGIIVATVSLSLQALDDGLFVYSKTDSVKTDSVDCLGIFPKKNVVAISAGLSACGLLGYYMYQKYFELFSKQENCPESLSVDPVIVVAIEHSPSVSAEAQALESTPDVHMSSENMFIQIEDVPALTAEPVIEGDQSQAGLRAAFLKALQDSDGQAVQKAIDQGLDLQNNADSFFFPLQDALTHSDDCQKTLEIIELLIQAGARWAFTLEDSLIIDSKEVMRLETMTQYLKSHWMLNFEKNPELSFRFAQLIPTIDALELKYNLKNESDLHFFVQDNNEILQEQSNVELCCKELAYYSLFNTILDGDVAQLKVLVGLGLNLNYVNSKGVSVLLHTIINVPVFQIDHAWSILSILLDAGAEWNEVTLQGISTEQSDQSNAGTMSDMMRSIADTLLLGNNDDVTSEYCDNLKKLSELVDLYENDKKLS